jgi:hypothetical protein
MDATARPVRPPVWPRLGAALVALAAGVAAAVVVALLLRTTLNETAGNAAGGQAPPPATAVAGPRTRTARFPAPPRDAVVLAGEDGKWAVGLALRPSGGAIALQASVVSPEGRGVSGLRTRFAVTTSRGVSVLAGARCGDGCYRASARIGAPPKQVAVTIAGGEEPARTLRFAAPEQWPPHRADRLIRRATTVYRRLRSLTIDERLATGFGRTLETHYTIVAPNRIAYRFSGGGRSIVIGARRWDRSARGPWRRSPQTPLAEPTPFWGAGDRRNAYLLGSRRIGGRIALVASFFEPGLPGWFTISVDRSTGRPLALRMVTLAHFMDHRYGSFNAPLRIAPP